jgi:lipopolysaccharide transport system ATP-binding protein
MRPAISVENLCKIYRIEAGVQGPYRTLRESIADGLSGLFKAAGQIFAEPTARCHRLEGDEAVLTGSGPFRALDDVSLEVETGEVVGIVGRNGAGKSTLLKILSQITEPTAGRVTIMGRASSLLEVGTGFHPELTGKENIYLNGAILGMSRREIGRKFDAIVDFAEIEPFLNMPVKRYSSGMYVRLAFSVAAHLEPEILIIDEVLAVGDVAFQKKCLGKMDEVSRHGRTVLFVSHNMMAVKSLCTRAVLLEKGRIALDGDVDAVVDRYLSPNNEATRTGTIPEDWPRIRSVEGEAIIRSVELTDLDGDPTTQFYFGQPFRVTFRCDVLEDIPDGLFEISISTLDGTHVTYSTSIDGGRGPAFLAKGRYQVSAEFDVVLLPREYTIDLGIHHQDGKTSDFVQRTLNFTVLRVAASGSGHYPWPRTRGLVACPADWTWCEASRRSHHRLQDDASKVMPVHNMKPQ